MHSSIAIRSTEAADCIQKLISHVRDCTTINDEHGNTEIVNVMGCHAIASYYNVSRPYATPIAGPASNANPEDPLCDPWASCGIED
jgi:hypothetical protein